MNFKKWLNELLKKGDKKNSNDKKNITNLAIVFLIGLLIIITINFFSGYSKNTYNNLNSNKSSSTDDTKKDTTEESTSTDENSSHDYEESIQKNLKNTLEQIEGVGKVEVMISFESGEEHVPAVNVNDTTNTTEEKDNEGGTRNTTQKNNGSTVVITNDGSKSEPLIVKTYNPKISGVFVVAEGAENKITELRISKAITDLFGLSEDKVNVYPMKK
ncbi:stage III sporulation protein AG [Clostridium kluyveri]|uniref:Stage III sporulation protein AG n=1 Tax=Clostridium kluyveri TaxID=1534 RepID=A0A1L5F6G5_CLOKL|nr:stage III sporulation protein AG [Clostridium kluyveri]APM38606.1 stage III sporulation protein AG [Clostridium kluyveri]UZQ50907.1 stage III sporulation protein AG [Clostridium kluyveri]